jgi:hypothetical protein
MDKEITMDRKWFIRLVLLLGVIAILAGGTAVADSLGYAIDWWTVDSGGGSSSGGRYGLSGTIGQPDAGEMAGGDYTLSGGFWVEVQPGYVVYLPLVMR